MTAFGQAALVLRREVALERAGHDVAVSVAPFVLALVVLAGLAFGARPAVLAATGPGLLWLTVLSAAVPLAPTVAIVERSEGAWDMLRGLVAPGALLAGKLTAVWLWLLAAWLVTAGLVAALFGAGWTLSGTLSGLAGTLGLAATTTVLGVLLPGGTHRSGLLAVLLLPASLPALLAGTELSTAGTPPAAWLVLLGVYDAVMLTTAWAVFPVLLEE